MSVPAPAFVSDQVPPDWPTAPEIVVTPELVTVKVRVPVSVTVPVNPRSYPPPRVTFPDTITALPKESGPPLACRVPAARFNVPVPAAPALPSDNVPDLRMTPPAKLFAADRTR